MDVDLPSNSNDNELLTNMKNVLGCHPPLDLTNVPFSYINSMHPAQEEKHLPNFELLG